MSKQRAPHPELGNGIAKGPIELKHEPNEINGSTKRYFALAYKKLKMHEDLKSNDVALFLNCMYINHH